MQVDAVKLQFLSSQGPMVMRLPILLVVCFGILFYYLGWAFMAGIAVFALTFLVNTKLARA